MYLDLKFGFFERKEVKVLKKKENMKNQGLVNFWQKTKKMILSIDVIYDVN